MSAPRRPAAGRRPATSRVRATRGVRTAAGAGVTAATAPARAGNGLTGRAALLGLVVCTLVFSAALPVREYVQQRSEIARLEQEQAQTRERVEALERAKQQLQDPAYIAAEARRRLHMAKPGEVAYVVIGPEPAAPAQAAGATPDTGPDAPWWAQVWGSVQTADRAGVEVADPDGPAASDGPAGPGDAGDAADGAAPPPTGPAAP